jgi:hypothetical protein
MFVMKSSIKPHGLLQLCDISSVVTIEFLFALGLDAVVCRRHESKMLSS